MPGPVGLEYMIVGTPDGRGIPPTMSRADLGVLDHFSLGVANAQAAYTLLWNEDRLAGQSNTPKIGRDAKWQLNLLDPDGTRAEIMELHAIGTPCCSPFTASRVPFYGCNVPSAARDLPLLSCLLAAARGGFLGFALVGHGCSTCSARDLSSNLL